MGVSSPSFRLIGVQSPFSIFRVSSLHSDIHIHIHIGLDKLLQSFSTKWTKKKKNNRLLLPPFSFPTISPSYCYCHSTSGTRPYYYYISCNNFYPSRPPHLPFPPRPLPSPAPPVQSSPSPSAFPARTLRVQPSPPPSAFLAPVPALQPSPSTPPFPSQILLPTPPIPAVILFMTPPSPPSPPTPSPPLRTTLTTIPFPPTLPNDNSPGNRTPSTRLMPAASRRALFHIFPFLSFTISPSPSAYLSLRSNAAAIRRRHLHRRPDQMLWSTLSRSAAMAAFGFLSTKNPWARLEPRSLVLIPVRRGLISNLLLFCIQSWP